MRPTHSQPLATGAHGAVARLSRCCVAIAVVVIAGATSVASLNAARHIGLAHGIRDRLPHSA